MLKIEKENGSLTIFAKQEVKTFQGGHDPLFSNRLTTRGHDHLGQKSKNCQRTKKIFKHALKKQRWE